MWIYWKITWILQKNTETLIDDSQEVGLEVNVEKTKYMLSRHQNLDQNEDIKIANRYQGYQENRPSQQRSRRLLYLYFDRYMFRLSLAIIRRNTQYNI
jgi:hypothetical protein